MYNYQNETQSTKWIENLAIEEINMEETGVINMDDHLNPEFFLEEASVSFMNELREKFDVFVTKFNELRGHESNATIKVFKISNTVNDFMLFRNSLRLIFARKAKDTIQVHFISNGKDLYSARLKKGESTFRDSSHEIKAIVGPFNDIRWLFQGEPVDQDALVRHYLSEFIRNSAQ
ncbi:MAG: hypothetical protein ACPGJV_07875 [Bacteriovoracaceae bacterium]